MKKLLTFIFFLPIFTNSFSQNADSINAIQKNHMNNIQVNMLFPFGYFSLQYEHAINKHFSLSIIGAYGYSYLSKKTPTPYIFECMPQLRYYFNKGKPEYNRGLYISGVINYMFKREYKDKMYDAVGDGILHNYYTKNPPAGYVNTFNTPYDMQTIYLGAGVGYQWIIKERLVIDLGISLQQGIVNSERYKDIPHHSDWSNISVAHQKNASISCNIGYTF